MKNEGKKFEEDFRDSVPSDIYYYRFRDGTANYAGTKNENTRFQHTNICDCILYDRVVLCFNEQKSYTGVSVTHKAFLSSNAKTEEGKLKKIKQMVDAQMHGIHAGYLFNMRDIDETYFVYADKVYQHVTTADRKSIPLDYIREHGYKLKAKKKRVRWRYDIKDMLNSISHYTDMEMEQ